MKLEQSCGAVVYRMNGDTLEFLLIESLRHHFSYPKGHSEGQESEVETALREIKEETDLDVDLDDNFREVISYLPNETAVKNVVFFVAEADAKATVHKQDSEIASYRWLPYEEAYELLSFPNDKKVLKHAREFIIVKKGL